MRDEKIKFWHYFVDFQEHEPRENNNFDNISNHVTMPAGRKADADYISVSRYGLLCVTGTGWMPEIAGITGWEGGRAGGGLYRQSWLYRCRISRSSQSGCTVSSSSTWENRENVLFTATFRVCTAMAL